MKKLFTAIFICFLMVTYGQEKNQDSLASKQSFLEKHSNPSLDNDLTLHFKNFLGPSLINSADLSKRKKEIVLQFNLDKKNRFINIRTNSKNNILNNAIINAFKLLSIDDLNLPEKSQLYNYTLQIICKENNKPLLKCSSIVVYSIPAVFNGCENSIKNYSALTKCNSIKVRDYFVSNFDVSLAKRSGLSGVISIYAKFTIDKDTRKFTNLKVKAPNDALIVETKRILYNFPNVIQPRYLFGAPVNSKYSLPLKVVVK